MLFIAISTISRHLVFADHFYIISDENERTYFPASQRAYAGVVQYDYTYERAILTSPNLQGFVFSYMFLDSTYALGIAYGRGSWKLGLNVELRGDSLKGTLLGFNLNKGRFLIKTSLGMLGDSLDASVFLRYRLNRQIHFLSFANLRKSLGILSLSFKPTVYRSFNFGMYVDRYAQVLFSSLEVPLDYRYFYVRASANFNVKTKSQYLLYGFTFKVDKLTLDAFVRDAFRYVELSFAYRFEIF